MSNSDALTTKTDNEANERLIAVNRVAKVVKGGRRFGFNALVAVGNGSGKVSIAMGKAKDVTEAIRKAMDNAKKRMVTVSIVDGTIPHEVIGKWGAARIMLKPAAPGTGVIAGGPARAILELAGVRNILTKCLGTTNAHNVARATLNGLQQIKTIEQIKALRQIAD